MKQRAKVAKERVKMEKINQQLGVMEHYLLTIDTLWMTDKQHDIAREMFKQFTELRKMVQITTNALGE